MQSDWLIPQLYSYPTMHKRLDESRMLPPWEERGDQLIWRGALTGVSLAKPSLSCNLRLY